MKQFPDADERPLDSYERDKARFGKLFADLRHKEDTRVINPTVPERFEIDHTELDLFVLDEKTKPPIGRPWLMVKVCRSTGLILGFDVSSSDASPGVEK